jgi:phage shock protein A
MSLTGTLIGALVALVPALAARRDKTDRTAIDDKTHPRFIAGYDAGLKDGRRAVEPLHRSRAQLIGHIELLERELAAERQMSAHWLAEAQRLIRENRRQEAAVLAPQMALYQQQAACSQQAQTQMQQHQQHQQNLAALGQQQLAFAQNQFCNCVPSRAQVWGAQHGLVQSLNDNT